MAYIDGKAAVIKALASAPPPFNYALAAAVGLAVSSFFQIQNEFAEHERKIEDLQNKVTVLSASVEGMETQHIQKLEEENKSLMQRLGIKK